MMICFRRNLKGTFRFIFSILFILAIPIISSSLLSCRVTVEGDPHYQGSGPGPEHRPVDPRMIEGQWFINANNTTGRLELSWIGNRFAGRILFDYLGQWEELTDIFLDSRTGRLQFRRPIGDQLYHGTLSGHQILGTFSSGGYGSYHWEARRP